jgi:polysaccharide export outer membrane protein
MPFRSFSYNAACAVFFICYIGLLHSCVPARKAIFFNGLQQGTDQVNQAAEEAAKRLYPGDRLILNIIIEHPDMALLNQGVSFNQGQSSSFGYLVDKDGNIELVKIGVIHVAGKTPAEVAEEVRKRVAVLYRDPTVTFALGGRVLFLGAGSVGGGAVGAGGGIVPITNDRLTLLEAFAFVGIGDPTAVRDRVWVIREKGGAREFATVDINSKDVFQSPYFYLRNNDIIYMEPNRVNTFLTINSPVRNIIFTSFTTLSLIFSILALVK